MPKYDRPASDEAGRFIWRDKHETYPFLRFQYGYRVRGTQNSDGTVLAIDTIAVEDEVAANMYERSELDYLIYNDSIGYADLILNSDPETYLWQVTDYHPLDT